MRPLSADELLQALEELSEELRAQSVKAHLYVVCGAAMALSFSVARTTYDLDTLIIRDQEPVLVAARRIAARHGWSPNWIHENATRLEARLPDRNTSTLYDCENLTVVGASPEFLLAMKMRAVRESDFKDIATLLDVLDITSPDEAFAIHRQVFPDQPLADVEEHGLTRIICELLSNPGSG